MVGFHKCTSIQCIFPAISDVLGGNPFGDSPENGALNQVSLVLVQLGQNPLEYKSDVTCYVIFSPSKRYFCNSNVTSVHTPSLFPTPWCDKILQLLEQTVLTFNCCTYQKYQFWDNRWPQGKASWLLPSRLLPCSCK